MSKILIHKNLKNKPLPEYSVVSLPSYVNIPKYTKFKNFLENNVDKINVWPSCDNQDIGALEVDAKSVSINSDKCIGCMMCLSTNKKLNKLEIPSKEIIESLYDRELIKKIHDKDIFSGSVFTFPFFKNRKTKSFEQYTSYKETTHISLWATSVLNFLSSDPESRMGKEIEIMKMDNPRDGRLDICISCYNSIFVGEAKVDLNSTITENRYRVQIPSYEKECKRFINDYNGKFKTKKELFICLVLGGSETDLLPETHPECSSRTGNKSKRFYQDIIKHKIKFVSANVLLLMTLYSMYHKKLLSWDVFFNKIFEENVIGLTTAGVVKIEDKKSVVEKIDRDIIISSEQPFF